MASLLVEYSVGKEEQELEEEVHHVSKPNDCSTTNKAQVELDSNENDGDEDGLAASHALPHQAHQVVMSPTDAMVSPCSEKLLQKGHHQLRGPKMWDLHHLAVSTVVVTINNGAFVSVSYHSEVRGLTSTVRVDVDRYSSTIGSCDAQAFVIPLLLFGFHDFFCYPVMCALRVMFCCALRCNFRLILQEHRSDTCRSTRTLRPTVLLILPSDTPLTFTTVLSLQQPQTSVVYNIAGTRSYGIKRTAPHKPGNHPFFVFLHSRGTTFVTLPCSPPAGAHSREATLVAPGHYDGSMYN